jgi:hypothetical protein
VITPQPSTRYVCLLSQQRFYIRDQAAVYSFGGDAMYDAVAKETPRSNPGPGEHEHPSAISTQVHVCRMKTIFF